MNERCNERMIMIDNMTLLAVCPARRTEGEQPSFPSPPHILSSPLGKHTKCSLVETDEAPKRPDSSGLRQIPGGIYRSFEGDLLLLPCRDSLREECRGKPR